MIYYELVIAHLHESLINLSGLTGKSITEETLDMVFKEFCVGK
jgi:tRNA U34 5-carboxymethylaminomethyl modifying GTPase MnmE/TrmE